MIFTAGFKIYCNLEKSPGSPTQSCKPHDPARTGNRAVACVAGLADDTDGHLLRKVWQEVIMLPPSLLLNGAGLNLEAER